MGFHCFKERRSQFAARKGERRIQRPGPMELLEEASEWASPLEGKVASTKDSR